MRKKILSSDNSALLRNSTCARFGTNPQIIKRSKLNIITVIIKFSSCISDQGTEAYLVFLISTWLFPKHSISFLDLNVNERINGKKMRILSGISDPRMDEVCVI